MRYLIYNGHSTFQGAIALTMVYMYFISDTIELLRKVMTCAKFQIDIAEHLVRAYGTDRQTDNAKTT